jgi:UDP-glucose 4-epimerase
MRILLTGGAGYIGSHTAIALLERGYEVIVVDDLRNGSREAISRVEEITEKSVDFYEFDLADQSKLDHVFSVSRIDAVLHFAGSKSVSESIAHPLAYYRNNLDTALSVLSTMVRHGVRKFVFSSSATVYEEPTQFPINERQHVGLGATNPYARTKVIIERVLMDIARADNAFELAILRYFNPVGAHESGRLGEDPKGIPNNLMPFVSQVALGMRDHVSVYGNAYETHDGTGVRDYVHVMDLATGHAAALENLSPGANVFNLGTGSGASVLEVIETYSRVSGRPVPYEIVPPRPGDVALSFADVSKAAGQLGWRAERSLEDACRDSWRWHSENPNGYISGSTGVARA